MARLMSDIGNGRIKMSSNYPAGVNDNDPHFDLPDAGEDESEPELCGRCGIPLNSTDYEAGFCTQCKEPI